MLSPSEDRILRVIRDFYADFGFYPSLQDIKDMQTARFTKSISRQMIGRYIGKLEQGGFLKRNNRKRIISFTYPTV